MMITVTAGVLLKNSKVFIGKRKPSGRLPGKWEFPGGKVEPGETPEQCLKRELAEELGLEAEVGPFLWEGIHRYDFGTVKLLFYRVYWDGSEIISNDHEAVCWVPLNGLLDYDFAPADWPFVEKLVKQELVAM